jgi:hypothetical protein
MPHAASYEEPTPCCLDGQDVDLLLVRLHAVHAKPRYDIAPELGATQRNAARTQEAAREHVASGSP